MNDNQKHLARYQEVRDDAADFFTGALSTQPLKIFFSGFEAELHLHPGHDEKTLFVTCAPETWLTDFHRSAQMALDAYEARELAALLLGFADAMDRRLGVADGEEGQC